jgi:hypothetical protein
VARHQHTPDKNRGQIVPYADPRAYTDRLNALFSHQGWTREYKIETMSNIKWVKKGEIVISGKVLVTCTVAYHRSVVALGNRRRVGRR